MGKCRNFEVIILRLLPAQKGNDFIRLCHQKCGSFNEDVRLCYRFVSRERKMIYHHNLCHFMVSQHMHRNADTETCSS